MRGTVGDLLIGHARVVYRVAYEYLSSRSRKPRRMLMALSAADTRNQPRDDAGRGPEMVCVGATQRQGLLGGASLPWDDDIVLQPPPGSEGPVDCQSRRREEEHQPIVYSNRSKDHTACRCKRETDRPIPGETELTLLAACSSIASWPRHRCQFGRLGACALGLPACACVLARAPYCSHTPNECPPSDSLLANACGFNNGGS